MRIIKFRGKDIETGEWVYGDLLHVGGGCIITTNSELREPLPDGETALSYSKDEIAVVKRETVSQFIGLLDKNGNEIYEGDIYRYDNPDSINEVSYCAGGGFAGFDLTPAIHNENRLLDVEVIGNIHDSIAPLNNTATTTQEDTIVPLRLTFTEASNVSGDQTCLYNVALNRSCTLEELIDYILKRTSEWGYIELVKGARIEYRYGKLRGFTFPSHLMRRRVRVVSASGGWSRMDYKVAIEES